MPTADERIAYLEGRFEEHSGSITMLRADFAALRSDVQDVQRHVETLDQRLNGRIDAFDTKLNGRIDTVEGKLSGRIDAVEGKLSGRIDAVEGKLGGRIDAVEAKLSAKIDALDTKMSRQFTWTVGIQVAMLIAIIGALLRVAAA